MGFDWFEPIQDFFQIEYKILNSSLLYGIIRITNGI
jgi:hypothetical protein